MHSQGLHLRNLSTNPASDAHACCSEVFVVVSLTLFLPICLEQFARDNGRLLPDKMLPCTTSAESQAPTPVADGARCVVKLGWAWIDTASFRCVLLVSLCVV
jgi:UMF1 family MFS transporter